LYATSIRFHLYQINNSLFYLILWKFILFILILMIEDVVFCDESHSLPFLTSQQKKKTDLFSKIVWRRMVDFNWSKYCSSEHFYQHLILIFFVFYIQLAAAFVVFLSIKCENTCVCVYSHMEQMECLIHHTFGRIIIFLALLQHLVLLCKCVVVVWFVFVFKNRNCCFVFYRTSIVDVSSLTGNNFLAFASPGGNLN
jgi:hypothetical protein